MTQTMSLTGTGKFYGTHGSELVTDERGKRYLLKRQDYFRSLIDKAVSVLAFRLGLPTVVVHIVGTDAAHEWADGATEIFPHWNFDATTLTDHEAERLTVEMAFDWLISNHDAHPAQFVEHHGQIVGLDKGQAFRYFENDKLSPDYHPNARYGEAEPIYHDMQRKGRLSDSPALRAFLDRVDAMDDGDFAKIFEEYMNEAEFQGFLAYGSCELFTEALITRKHSLRADVLAYIAD